MDLSKKNTLKLVLTINSIILFYWALVNYEKVLGWGGNIISVLLPIILGICLAFIINMPMRAIERSLFDRMNKPFINKIKRPLSLLLSLILFVVGIFLLLFIILPELGKTLSTVYSSIPAFINRVGVFINEILVLLPEGEVQRFLADNWQKIGDQAFTFFEGLISILLGSSISIISGVFGGIFTFFIAFVLAIYILLQKEKLSYQFKKLLYSVLKEKTSDRIVYLLRLTNQAFNNFFTGQCLESVIIGVLFFATMSIFGFPYALMSGVIIGVTALIPIFGAFIGCFISAFFILVTVADKVIPFLILFLVIQQIEGNLIYPKVVGGSVGLPGMWVLIAVSIGGSLMGIIGMIVMVPLSSVIYAVLGEFASKRVEERNIPLEKLEPSSK